MIGNLRTRVGVYKPSVAADPLGGVQTNWILHCQTWAHIKPKNTAEKTKNGRPTITKTYVIVIRWQKNFPKRARLLWAEKTLRVLSCSDPDTRRERFHLICEEEEQ